MPEIFDYAIRRDNIERLDRYIEAGGDVNGRAADGRTPLHMALALGWQAGVTKLLAAGADVNARDREGYTPLHRVAMLDMYRNKAAALDVAKALLDGGADPNARNHDGRTPLHVVASEAAGKPEGAPVLGVVKALLAGGADPNVQDKDGLTPLRSAVRSIFAGSPGEPGPVVKALLAAGADPNVQDANGLTALSDAIDHDGRIGALQDMLAAGANPNLGTIAGGDYVDGLTPLHWAAASYGGREPEKIRALLAAGADPNAKAANDDTPLHVLADDMGHTMEPREQESAGLLIAAGANAAARNDEGKTPAELAKNPAMKALLRVEQERIELRAVADEAQAPAARVPSLGGLASRLDARTAVASPTHDEPEPTAPRAAVRRRL